VLPAWSGPGRDGPARECEESDLDQLLAGFAEAAAHPLAAARQLKAMTGKKVIGHFPMHFPGEIAHAAGTLSLLLQEAEDPITVGLAGMFPFYCGYTRSVVDQAMKGDFAFLDAIMFGDHCVQLLGAADVIRWEMPDTRILFNQLISSMDAPWAREQARESFQQLGNELGELIGQTISAEALRNSIRVFNRNRAMIRRIYDLRRSGRVALRATQLQHIVKSSMVMDKELHTAMLERLLQAIEARPASRPSGVPVYLSGHFCQPPKPALLDLFEECGAVVVDDDLYHGYRYVASDVEESGDPLDALADWYLGRNRRVPCPTRADKHADWDAFLVDAVARSRARGVIVLMAKFCEPHMYYYPELKEAFERHGIAHLLIETEHEAMPIEALKTRVETFLEIVKRRAAA
jgi:bcr-type benzoyl-CoA reductase subunit C